MPEPKPPSHALHVLGWKEWLALPELGVDKVRAKVDSGAKTSALHAEDVSEFEREGRMWLRFGLRLPWPGPHTPADIRTADGEGETDADDDDGMSTASGVALPPLHYAEAPLLEYREVTSSNGESEARPVITTDLALFGTRWPIEITLTTRHNMRFPMLLGREAMTGRAVIDVSRSFAASGVGRTKRKTQRRREAK